MTEAYPLQWPEGWVRTERPKRAKFDTSQNDAQNALLNELRMLGAKHVVISSDIKLRNDGLPYSRRKPPEDKGIAVYFLLDGVQQCIPCDKWDRTKDNMQAIRKTVAALRGLERWGAKEMVNAAFRGFKALPDPDHKPWYAVLGVHPQATQDEIKIAFRALSHRHHPDKGGDEERFKDINAAYQKGMQENIL